MRATVTTKWEREVYELLVDLYEWNAIMGYWEAPVWDRCKAMRDELADQQEPKGVETA